MSLFTTTVKTGVLRADTVQHFFDDFAAFMIGGFSWDLLRTTNEADGVQGYVLRSKGLPGICFNKLLVRLGFTGTLRPFTSDPLCIIYVENGFFDPNNYSLMGAFGLQVCSNRLGPKTLRIIATPCQFFVFFDLVQCDIPEYSNEGNFQINDFMAGAANDFGCATHDTGNFWGIGRTNGSGSSGTFRDDLVPFRPVYNFQSNGVRPQFDGADIPPQLMTIRGSNLGRPTPYLADGSFPVILPMFTMGGRNATAPISYLWDSFVLGTPTLFPDKIITTGEKINYEMFTINGSAGTLALSIGPNYAAFLVNQGFSH